MANIIAIITAVILAAAVYVAHKNHAALETEIESRQTQERYLGQNQAKLAELRLNRDETIAELEQVQETTEERRSEEENQVADNREIEGRIKDMGAQKERNARKVAEIEDQTKELGEVSQIAGNIRSLRNRIQDFEDEKSAKEATLANLMNERNSTQRIIDEYSSENSAISSQQSYFQSARIGAVYGNWGFVTLNAGNSDGVVGSSKLDVVRNGETVAQLRVRSVEANRASADVIPDSIAEDTVLMVGDRVVPSGE